MRYLSLFSGIEAATVAWAPLSWTCVGVSEIASYPASALKHHYPHVPNLGDITKITEADIARLGRLDLIVFGSPCQDLSVAGKRKGLDGERSGLFFAAMRIIGWARKHCALRFALWENVPGAFTSNKGGDFAAVVGMLASLDPDAEPAEVPPQGWGNEGCILGEKAMVEWSTLDAQWFGVAQRRRRVFAVADFGDWASRPPILLEPQGMRGDSAPRREAGQDVAGTLASRTGAGGYPGSDEACDGHVIVAGSGPVQVAYGGNNTTGPIEVGTALNACASASGRLDFESETFVLAFNSNAQPNEMRFDPNLSAPLTCSQNSSVAFQSSQSGVRLGDVHATLDSNNGSRRHNGVLHGTQVRRLTPRECERLQAFPDDYTLIPIGKKMAADGPRYKALGNSMCVNVMRWIGTRIEATLMWSELLEIEEDLFAA